MADSKALARMQNAAGMVAALDQSGGSTPGALQAYGYEKSAYRNEDEMFRLVHEMRVRIMTAPAFTGERVVATILFEATMDGTVAGKPVPDFLWNDRGVVPFLKIDQGLLPEADGVRLMKPIEKLEPLLGRAARLGIFGTKMRSTIRLPSPTGIKAIVDQQFEIADLVMKAGLMPIIEPEALIDGPDREAAERLLLDAIRARLDRMEPNARVMLKLTIPAETDLYKPLVDHPQVLRVLALSGGFRRDDACRRLRTNQGMIASFSRALLEGLRHDMDANTFNATLASSIDEIYRASVLKAA